MSVILTTITHFLDHFGVVPSSSKTVSHLCDKDSSPRAKCANSVKCSARRRASVVLGSGAHFFHSNNMRVKELPAFIRTRH